MHTDYEKRESSQTAIERLTSSDNMMNNSPLLIFRYVLQRISHTGPVRMFISALFVKARFISRRMDK